MGFSTSFLVIPNYYQKKKVFGWVMGWGGCLGKGKNKMKFSLSQKLMIFLISPFVNANVFFYKFVFESHPMYDQI
jgi:hypothetical protein